MGLMLTLHSRLADGKIDIFLPGLLAAAFDDPIRVRVSQTCPAGQDRHGEIRIIFENIVHIVRHGFLDKVRLKLHNFFREQRGEVAVKVFFQLDGFCHVSLNW